MNDIINCRDHLLVSCSLYEEYMFSSDGNINLGAHSTTFSIYDWTDTVEQQYYYDTRYCLQ